MTCPICRTESLNTTIAENYKYFEVGLPNIILKGIPLRSCSDCGAKLTSIPNIEGLHRLIAVQLILKEERLTSAEIKFLRKHLGWSGADFARNFHTTPTTISRWENVDNPTPMKPQSELLLRLLVAEGNKIKDYKSHMEQVASKELFTDLEIELYHEQGNWAQAA